MKNNETNWATLLREAVTAKDNLPPGDGWITIKKLAENYNFSISKVHRRIVALLLEGKIERFNGTENGRPNTWYRELSKSSKLKKRPNRVEL
jgi:predicted transcriptional regulator